MSAYDTSIYLQSYCHCHQWTVGTVVVHVHALCNNCCYFYYICFNYLPGNTNQIKKTQPFWENDRLWLKSLLLCHTGGSVQLSQGLNWNSWKHQTHLHVCCVFPEQDWTAFTDPVITSYRQVCAPQAIEYKLYFEFSDALWAGVDAWC